MNSHLLSFAASSEKQTIAIGMHLGRLLGPGDVIALSGELGSGKTRFTKGIARGLEVPEEMVVTSPSFSLVNEYEGRCVLFHIDAYRLESLSGFMAAGLEEYLYMEGVVAMEWSERCAEILPEWSLKVDIGIKAENERELVFSGEHARAAELIKALEIEEIETN